MKLLRKFDLIADRAVFLPALLGIAILIFLLLGITADIILRYFFSCPIYWMLEVCTYCLLGLTLSSSAWVLKEEGHVKIDVVFNRLNPRTQSLLNITTSIFGAIIFLIITFYGVKVTYYHFQIGWYAATLLRPPTWPMFACIPVGSLLLSIQFLRRSFGYLRSWRVSPDKEP